MASTLSAAAQLPIAGSGALPPIDPLARSSYVVIEGVKKVLTDRASQQPFRKIKACFRQSRVQTAMREICHQHLESFHRRILLTFQATLTGIPPLEIYIRLVELSGDADAAEIRNDLFALKGVVALVDEARRFRAIKECYRDAGPQPAIHQICRRRLDGFLNEIMRTRGVELRDISPKAIKRRLLTVATAGQVGFMGGDKSVSASLRDIRKQQEDRKAEARLAMVKAKALYCASGRSKRTTNLARQLREPGICICSYGRRYIGSGASLRNRPVRAANRQCGAEGRFRVGDLNGGRLNHGDWITLRAAHDGYVSLNRDGIVYANRQRPGKSEKFRLIKATNIPGRIRSGEMIALVSALGFFVVPDLKNGRLKVTKQTPAPHEFFVLMAE